MANENEITVQICTRASTPGGYERKKFKAKCGAKFNVYLDLDGRRLPVVLTGKRVTFAYEIDEDCGIPKCHWCAEMEKFLDARYERAKVDLGTEYKLIDEPSSC